MNEFKGISVGTLALLAASAAVFSGCSAQQPVRSESARLGCEQVGESPNYLAPGKVSAVRRVTRTEHIARAIQAERTAGADIFVHAEPGLTPDYLQRALSCQAESNASSANVLRDESGKVAISVRSEEGRLAVRAVSADPRVGERIWQRASALREPAVTVEQVATLGAATY